MLHQYHNNAQHRQIPVTIENCFWDRLLQSGKAKPRSWRFRAVAQLWPRLCADTGSHDNLKSVVNCSKRALEPACLYQETSRVLRGLVCRQYISSNFEAIDTVGYPGVRNKALITTRIARHRARTCKLKYSTAMRRTCFPRLTSLIGQFYVPQG